MACPDRARFAALLVTLVTACGGSNGPGPGSPGSPGSPTPPPAPIDFASLFPPDLFTGAPAPLELTVTPAATGAFSGVVGPSGGTVSVTGPDGTQYSLEIPPGALPIETGITATPLQDVTGFPFDAPLAHRVGVAFTPSAMDLEWKPGAGAGINQFIEAKIEKVEGTGDVTVSNFDVQLANLPGSDCTVTKHSPVQKRTTAARLKRLDWEYPDDPATPDWAASGYPTRLVMVLDPGAVDTSITLSCPQVSTDLPIDVYQPDVFLVINGYSGDPEGTETEHLLDHGWTFPSLHPFQAELDAPSSLTVSGDLKLTLHHTPQ